MSEDMVSRAKALAHRAHAGQVDKAGRPYIEHVARVAKRMNLGEGCTNEKCVDGDIYESAYDAGCDDPDCDCNTYRLIGVCPDCQVAEAVAWLHDVLEDCDECFHEAVFVIGSDVALSVMRLTRCRTVTDDRYYELIRLNKTALRVKLADIADNSSEERLALLDEKTAARLRRKYAKAILALTGGQ